MTNRSIFTYYTKAIKNVCIKCSQNATYVIVNHIAFNSDVRSTNDISHLKRQFEEIFAMEQHYYDRWRLLLLHGVQTKFPLLCHKKSAMQKSRFGAIFVPKLNFAVFFEDKETVTLNQGSYRDMITNFYM